MEQILYASFTDPSLAERAVGALLDHGVRGEDVSLVAHVGTPPGEAGEAPSPARDPVRAAREGISTTTAGDAAQGAMVGAGVGLAVGAVAAVASLFIPGVGLVGGGGALAVALGGTLGTTAAGAVAGGLTGFLRDLGVPEDAAARYGEAVERGGALIAVHVPSGPVDRTTVESLLEKYGAAYLDTYALPVAPSEAALPVEERDTS